MPDDEERVFWKRAYADPFARLSLFELGRFFRPVTGAWYRGDVSKFSLDRMHSEGRWSSSWPYPARYHRSAFAEAELERTALHHMRENRVHGPCFLDVQHDRGAAEAMHRD